MLDKLKNELTSHWAWTLGQSVVDGSDDRAQVQSIIMVTTVGIVAIIGILIFDEVETSIGSFASSDLSNSSSNVTDGFGDAMDLIPVVLLVMVASLVIAVVQQF